MMTTVALHYNNEAGDVSSYRLQSDYFASRISVLIYVLLTICTVLIHKMDNVVWLLFCEYKLRILFQTVVTCYFLLINTYTAHIWELPSKFLLLRRKRSETKYLERLVNLTVLLLCFTVCPCFCVIAKNKLK